MERKSLMLKVAATGRVALMIITAVLVTAAFGTGYLASNSHTNVSTVTAPIRSVTHISTMSAQTATTTETDTITSIWFVPEGYSMVVEVLVIIPIEGVDAFVCGTTTAVAGTIATVGNTTTTKYMFSTATIGNTSQRFLNGNFTTITSTSMETETSTFTSRLFTLTSTSQGITVCNFP